MLLHLRASPGLDQVQRRLGFPRIMSSLTIIALKTVLNILFHVSSISTNGSGLTLNLRSADFTSWRIMDLVSTPLGLRHGNSTIRAVFTKVQHRNPVCSLLLLRYRSSSGSCSTSTSGMLLTCADPALGAPVRATELQKENSRDPHLTSSRLCGLGCRLSPFRTRFLKALSLV